MDEDNESVLLHDNAEAVSHLRRAIPIIRLYLHPGSSGEQEAAKAALVRLAKAIHTSWRKRKDQFDWIWNPRAQCIYEAVTRSCRWQLTEADPPQFARTVYDELFRVVVEMTYSVAVE